MPDTLTITDNRTGAPTRCRSGGRDPRDRLRQIKVDPDDFGLMSYDPAFLNTASTRSADHLHRRRQRHPPLPRLPDRAARRESTYLETAYLLLFGELPTAAELAEWSDDDHASTRSSTRT